MEAARKTWISSTLAGETVALAAARAVMLVYAEGGVCEKLAERGKLMRTGLENAIRASRTEGIAIAGIDPMWYLTFTSPELETDFLVSAAAAGVLFKRGPYNFPSLAHDEPTIHEIESRTSNALVSMRDAEGGAHSE
jgi:glutamate-1-semialdehyde 2,1-aminomutase